MTTKSVIIRLDVRQDALLKAMVKASGKNQQQFCMEKIFVSAQDDSSVLSEVVKSQQETIRQQQETIAMLSNKISDSRQHVDTANLLTKGDISYQTEVDVCVDRVDASTSLEKPKYKVGQKIRGDEVEMLLLNPNILKEGKRVLVDGCIWLIGHTANYAQRTATVCEVVPQAVLDRYMNHDRFHRSTTILEVIDTLEQYRQYLDFLKQPEADQLSSDTMDKLSRSWDRDKYSWKDALRKAQDDLAQQLRNNPEATQEDILEVRQDVSEALSDAPESTLEVSQDVSEVIPDALEFTLDVTPTLPEVTQAVTLTRDEFIAKFGMMTDTGEISQTYSIAFKATNNKGFWTAPDGTMWTKTGISRSARWTRYDDTLATAKASISTSLLRG